VVGEVDSFLVPRVTEGKKEGEGEEGGCSGVEANRGPLHQEVEEGGERVFMTAREPGGKGTDALVLSS